MTRLVIHKVQQEIENAWAVPCPSFPDSWEEVGWDEASAFEAFSGKIWSDMTCVSLPRTPDELLTLFWHLPDAAGYYLAPYLRFFLDLPAGDDREVLLELIESFMSVAVYSPLQYGLSIPQCRAVSSFLAAVQDEVEWRSDLEDIEERWNNAVRRAIDKASSK